MAQCARPAGKYGLSALLLVGFRGNGWTGLRRLPCREFAARLGDDQDLHVRMLRPAELSATPKPGACLGDGDPQPVAAAGDDVLLAVQVRQPETVDHIR